MPRAICRCGHPLTVPSNGSESARVVCPNCGARVRVRHSGPAGAGEATQPDDGFIRFFCPCGRRLKVNAAHPPSHGKCPDCGAIVPVPEAGQHGTLPGLPPGHPETPTAELSPSDLAALERWTHDHLARAANAGDAPSTATLKSTGPPPEPPTVHRVEAGLRVCPRCGRPVHLGADKCRECGTPVPRR